MNRNILYLNTLLAKEIAKKTEATALFEILLDSSDSDTISILEETLSDLYAADAKINILKYMLENKSKNEN